MDNFFAVSLLAYERKSGVHLWGSGIKASRYESGDGLERARLISTTAPWSIFTIGPLKMPCSGYLPMWHLVRYR